MSKYCEILDQCCFLYIFQLNGLLWFTFYSISEFDKLLFFMNNFWTVKNKIKPKFYEFCFSCWDVLSSAAKARLNSMVVNDINILTFRWVTDTKGYYKEMFFIKNYYQLKKNSSITFKKIKYDWSEKWFAISLLLRYYHLKSYLIAKNISFWCLIFIPKAIVGGS